MKNSQKVASTHREKRKLKRFERIPKGNFPQKFPLGRRRHIINSVGGQKKTGCEAPVFFQKGDIMKNEK